MADVNELGAMGICWGATHERSWGVFGLQVSDVFGSFTGNAHVENTGMFAKMRIFQFKPCIVVAAVEALVVALQ